jgi:branched-chain amino acid transport system substrate-binding protein
MIAAACSSDDSDDDTTTTAAGAEETTTTAAAAEETTTTAAAAEDTTTTAAGGDMAVACDEPVKVGVITDQTGALAIYGAHIMRSFPHGMEYATGAPAENDVYTLGDCQIEVIYKDDQSDPETTATLARELIEVDDVDIIVGSVSSGATAGIQELALANDVIHIAAPAAANDLTGATFNPNSFRTSRNNYQDAASMCKYLPTVYETFVQIAPDYSFGYGGAAAMRDACTLEGGELVVDDIFAPLDTTDFTPYMEQILDSGAEAWYVTWAGGGFVPMMQAATDLGVVDEMALAASFVDNAVMPTFFAGLEGTTSGILYHYTLPDNEINDWLVAKTQEDNDTVPDLFDADGMNAGLMIVEALKATGGDASADALRTAMEGMTFQGPKGEINIRAEDHVAMQDMYIVTLTNLDDPEFKFFELVTVNRPDVPCLLEGDYVDRCGSLPVGSLGG